MSLFGDHLQSITRITPLPRDPNQRRVYVGRKAVVTLRSSDIERLALAVGQPWTEELADTIRHEEAVGLARQAAMKAIGRRAYSSGELLELLRRKKHDAAIAQTVVDDLVADKWIDDEAYARVVAAEITRSKPAGKSLIAGRLRRRKIDSALASRVGAEIERADSPLQSALQLASSKLDSMSDLPRLRAMRRIADLLARRGFDDDIIASVLDRLGLSDST